MVLKLMTEERFWYDFEDVNGHKIVDFKNDKEYPLETIGDFREVVDLMNGLTAKNKVLRKEIERLKRQNEDILYNNAKNMESLEKENEKLKQLICDNYEEELCNLCKHQYIVPHKVMQGYYM